MTVVLQHNNNIEHSYTYTYICMHNKLQGRHLCMCVSYKSAKNWETCVLELWCPLFFVNLFFFLFLVFLLPSSSPSLPAGLSSDEQSSPVPGGSLFLCCWNMPSTDQNWMLCRAQLIRYSLSWVRARLLTGKPSLSPSIVVTTRPGKSWQALAFKCVCWGRRGGGGTQGQQYSWEKYMHVLGG